MNPFVKFLLVLVGIWLALHLLLQPERYLGDTSGGEVPEVQTY